MPAAPAIAAAAAVVGTAYSVYSGEKNASQQRKAQQQAKKAAEAQALQAEQDFNRANAKKANVGSLLTQAQQSAGGLGSTMLTGGGGVQGSLNLGKNSLLGQ
jgi:hypothetical protein